MRMRATVAIMALGVSFSAVGQPPPMRPTNPPVIHTEVRQLMTEIPVECVSLRVKDHLIIIDKKPVLVEANRPLDGASPTVERQRFLAIKQAKDFIAATSQESDRFGCSTTDRNVMPLALRWRFITGLRRGNAALANAHTGELLMAIHIRYFVGNWAGVIDYLLPDGTSIYTEFPFIVMANPAFEATCAKSRAVAST